MRRPKGREFWQNRQGKKEAKKLPTCTHEGGTMKEGMTRAAHIPAGQRVEKGHWSCYASFIVSAICLGGKYGIKGSDGAAYSTK
jgi:hypothetical protein